jgi:hypothetical protein
MKKIIIMLTVMLFSQNLVFAQNAEIKKSAKSGICYSSSSKFYKNLKNFEPHKTMDKCIAAGGKIQKTAVKKNNLIKI